MFSAPSRASKTHNTERERKKVKRLFNSKTFSHNFVINSRLLSFDIKAAERNEKTQLESVSFSLLVSRNIAVRYCLLNLNVREFCQIKFSFLSFPIHSHRSSSFVVHRKIQTHNFKLKAHK